MAEYLIPSFDEFVQRYPEFAEEDEYYITYLLTTVAPRKVDETWLVGDYALAIMAYVAHLIMVGPAGSGGIGGSSDVVSESFGPISTTYARRALTATSSSLSETSYGRDFEEMRRANHPPILVIKGRC